LQRPYGKFHYTIIINQRMRVILLYPTQMIRNDMRGGWKLNTSYTVMGNDILLNTIVKDYDGKLVLYLEIMIKWETWRGGIKFIIH
jgi:hypothetical protein